MMSILLMANSTLVFFGTGVVIAISFAYIQLKVHKKNEELIDSLVHFFVEDSAAYSAFTRDDVCQVKTTKGHDRLNGLIEEINLYVQKSIGTADFNIIQNKTERCIESLYEHATAELSFPTYIGLMGTFTGTFIGLIGFLISGNDLSDESKVTNLIIGVLVSMLTSLFGLLLTTRGNHKAAQAKKDLDEKKNDFLDFIQIEVIPKLQTTVTTLQQTLTGFVPRFDEVIGNFERTFTGVIGRFRETFDECTKNFGTEFRQNTRLIANTVSALNASIGHITENVENQRKLLQELRSEQMFYTLQQFVDAANTFKATAADLDGYNVLIRELIESSRNVVSLQTDYARSLHVPQQIAEQLNRILDRIAVFEQSINALGESLAQSQMLGNQEMLLIKQHLESFEEKKQIADRFLDTSNEELEAIFREQGKLVKALFDHYQQQLETERDELSAFVRETLQIITKKKNDLLTHLERAFDVGNINAMFAHLKSLPDIDDKLDEIGQAIIRNEQLEQHTRQLATAFQLLNDSLTEGNAQLIGRVTSSDDNMRTYLAQVETAIDNLNTSVEESAANQMSTHLKTLPDIEDKLAEIREDIIRNEQLELHIRELAAALKLLNSSLTEGKTQMINNRKDLQTYFAQVETILEGIRTSVKENSASHVRAVNVERKALSQTLTEIGKSSEKKQSRLTAKIEDVDASIKQLRELLEEIKRNDV